MKKQLSLSTIKKLFLSIIISASLLQSFNTVHAAQTKKHNTSATNTQVQYMGKEDRLLVFLINHKNSIKEKFVLELVDEEGEILYQKQFDDLHLTKKIYISSLVDDFKLTFRIRSVSQKFEQAFKVNFIARYNDELLVKGL